VANGHRLKEANHPQSAVRHFAHCAEFPGWSNGWPYPLRPPVIPPAAMPAEGEQRYEPRSREEPLDASLPDGSPCHGEFWTSS
jgi:hypothetical protein